MLVSWNWLQDYVNVGVSVEAFADRLTMTGLNLESIEPAGDDFVVDFEVTSNRPDCLGHVGIAREAAVMFGKELCLPDPRPATGGGSTTSAVTVDIECPELCPRYIARVVRGVKVGPSPEWLRKRLEAVGVASVNNIVDITNNVMLECGQPLHAFDLDRLAGGAIVVRRAKTGETLQAIDHRAYALQPHMCVIADAKQPVAIAGVMGGATTEIASRTVNVLIEAASFAPRSVRATARQLNLHSPSSYRFERALDPLGPEYASRRCAELILQLAGGELLEGRVLAGTEPTSPREAITMRFAQCRRILGIEIPADECCRILKSLGLEEVGTSTPETGTFIPPSWRGDLTREVDLIEEVARVHGYEQIPDNELVPLCTSSKSRRDRVAERVRETLTACGFYEAITMTFVSAEEQSLVRPAGELPALFVEHSSRRHENQLRQSLIPSLLKSRRENERHGSFQADLFEIARVYLSTDSSLPEQSREPLQLGLLSGRPFVEMKGVVETLVRRLNRDAVLDVRPTAAPHFTPGRGAELLLNGEVWGWVGELDRQVTDRLDLRDTVCAAEVSLVRLEYLANLIPQAGPLPQYQAVDRDLNFVLDDDVTWAALEATAREAAGALLERVSFGGQYKGKQIPDDKKSYVISLRYRSAERTLTSEEVDTAQAKVIAACGEKLSATLRG
jgi:phenylalanyl-tRNA synthetase beta chain